MANECLPCAEKKRLAEEQRKLRQNQPAQPQTGNVGTTFVRNLRIDDDRKNTRR